MSILNVFFAEVPVQETYSPEELAKQIGFSPEVINKAAKKCGKYLIHHPLLLKKQTRQQFRKFTGI